MKRLQLIVYSVDAKTGPKNGFTVTLLNIRLGQENMRGQRGTLPVMGLRSVIVSKVTYRLVHKRKCVFQDVCIKTKVSA